jgi:hypothetical protein
MIGTSGSASRTCHTQRTATGRTAGPDSPPDSPASAGRKVTGSMAMPGRVLIMDSPSAPADTQAFATAAMSVTSGDSFAKTGMSYLALPRTAATTWPAAAASRAKGRPAADASGQPRFTSIAVTPAASESREASSPYSRAVWPAMFTKVRAPRDSSHGRSRCRNPSMPGPCRPGDDSRPLGVSASRGAGFPARGSSMTDFVITAPIRAMSVNWASSRPVPAHPDAVRTGLGRSRCPIRVRRSAGMPAPLSPHARTP